MQPATLVRKGKDKAISDKEMRQIKMLHKLQNNLGRQNMHDVMSPLSAISGYLDLMEMYGNSSSDEMFRHYKEKIEKGLSEVNGILAHLHELYRQGSEAELLAETFKMDLNWLIQDVISHMPALKSHMIDYENNGRPVYLESDMESLRLILLRLLDHAGSCCSEGSRVKVSTLSGKTGDKLMILFSASEHRIECMERVLNCGSKLECKELREDALMEGLFISSQLIRESGWKIDIMQCDRNKVMIRVNFS